MELFFSNLLTSEVHNCISCHDIQSAKTQLITIYMYMYIEIGPQCGWLKFHRKSELTLLTSMKSQRIFVLECFKLLLNINLKCELMITTIKTRYDLLFVFILNTRDLLVDYN